jgi:hypothetical protein
MEAAQELEEACDEDCPMVVAVWKRLALSPPARLPLGILAAWVVGAAALALLGVVACAKDEPEHQLTLIGTTEIPNRPPYSCPTKYGGLSDGSHLVLRDSRSEVVAASRFVAGRVSSESSGQEPSTTAFDRRPCVAGVRFDDVPESVIYTVTLADQERALWTFTRDELEKVGWRVSLP